MMPIILPHTECSEDDYHGNSGYGPGLWLTRSAMHCFLQTKRGFWLRYVAKEPLAQFGGNSATNLGSYFEAKLTGIGVKDYAIIPQGVKLNTKAGKEWAADHEGMLRVTNIEARTVELMLKQLRSEPALQEAVEDATEYSTTVRFEEHGLRQQVRMDALSRGGRILDFKTTSKPLDRFRFSCEMYGYDLQAAMYRHAWKFATGEDLPFQFAVFQTVFPFDCALMELTPDALEQADLQYRAAVNALGGGVTYQGRDYVEAI